MLRLMSERFTVISDPPGSRLCDVNPCRWGTVYRALCEACDATSWTLAFARVIRLG